MFCNYCGAPNPDDARYCRACGRSMNWNPAQTPAASPSTAPTSKTGANQRAQGDGSKTVKTMAKSVGSQFLFVLASLGTAIAFLVALLLTGALLGVPWVAYYFLLIQAMEFLTTPLGVASAIAVSLIVAFLRRLKRRGLVSSKGIKR